MSNLAWLSAVVSDAIFSSSFDGTRYSYEPHTQAPYYLIHHWPPLYTQPEHSVNQEADKEEKWRFSEEGFQVGADL